MANELKHKDVGTVLTEAEYDHIEAHQFDSQATGDIAYASSADQISRLAIGSTGAILTVTGGVPVWDTTWTPTGSLIPTTDDTYDLGASGAAWKDLFLEGDITLTDAGGITTSAGALTITSAAAATWSSSAGALTLTSAAAATWSTAAGALTIDGDDGITLQTTGSGNVTVSEILDITDSTDASDATGDTGALRTEGGASIAKKLYVGTDADVDGTANLDNTDIDGTLVVDGTNISLDSTTTFNIDNSNTSNGITIGTATSGVPISIGHTTSETTINGNLTVSGTQTVVNTVTMNAANAVIFEGATADAYETTLTIVDPTADHAVYMPNQSGYLPVLAAASTTQVSSTPAELNLIDGGTARGTTSVASGDGILINDAGTMRMTNVDTVSTYFASHSVGGTNIVTTGTIGTGVWAATDVAVAHGGTGASTATGGFDALSPMTAEGDVLYGGSSGTVTKLAKGSDTQVLTLASGVPSWATPTTGDITGVTAGVGLSGGGSSGSVTLTLDLSELSTVTPADGDFFSTLDSDGANEQKTTTTALATLFAGTGLTASSSVIGVDAAQTGITSLLATDIKIGEDAQTIIDFETANEIHFDTNNAERARIDSAGQVFIGDTANSNSTVGLTINSGTNTDHILSFKFTGSGAGFEQPATGNMEIDTYGRIKAAHGGKGGLNIVGATGENDSGLAHSGIYLEGWTGIATDTTRTTSGYGAVRIGAKQTNGSNGLGAVASDGNLVSIDTDNTTRFIFDTEGSAHADVEWVAYAQHDDLALIADMESELLLREDEAQTSRRHTLENTGIIGKHSWHMEKGKPRAMVNMTRLSMLHHGALIQVAQRFEELENKLLALEAG